MRVEIKSVQHLRDIHRIGATCANLDGERFILWGGTIDATNANNAQELESKRCDVWIYETFTETWIRQQCSYAPGSDFKLPTLTGSTSTIMGRQMIVFGGHSPEDNWINSLYALDLDSFTWSDLGSDAIPLPTRPIRSDKNVSWAFEGKFYVFGGYGWSQTEHMPELMDKQKDLQLCPDYRWPKFGWNNQLVEYNSKTNTWSWPSYSGRCPSARAAHSGTLMGDVYYVFGGRDTHERLNDLYSLDMKNFEWRQIAVIADPSLSTALNHSSMVPIRHPFDDLDNNNNNDTYIAIVETTTNNEMQQQQRATSRQSNTFRPSTSASDDETQDQNRPSYLVERWSLNQTASSSTIAEANSCSGYDQEEISEVISETDEHPDLFDVVVVNESTAQAVDDQQQQQQQQIRQREQISQPIGRSFASFTPISHDSILLYGGICSQEQNLDDCWCYSIKRNCWKQIELNSKRPRLWHAGLMSNEDEVVLLAGSSGNIDNFCTDVLVLSSSPSSLKKLAFKSVASLIENKIITSDAIQNIPESLRSIIAKSYFHKSKTLII